MAAVSFMAELRAEIGSKHEIEVDQAAMLEVPWVDPVIAAVKSASSGAIVLLPDKFAFLRSRAGFSEERYMDLLKTLQPSEAKGGRSGASFWTSPDEMFTVDYKTLEKIFTAYLDHIDHDDSCLVLLLGAYQFQGKKILVMEGIRPVLGNARNVFDLKGLHREESKFDPIAVSPESRTKVLEAVRLSTEFLKDMNLVDYSLLVVEQENGDFVVAIIDFLMQYTFQQVLKFGLRYHWRKPFLKGVKKILQYHCGEECHFVNASRYKERIDMAASRFFVSESTGGAPEMKYLLQ